MKFNEEKHEGVKNAKSCGIFWVLNCIQNTEFRGQKHFLGI